MQIHIYVIATVCIFVHAISATQHDYFTSIIGMQKLLQIESKIVDSLNSYISDVHNEIASLQKELDEIHQQKPNISTDFERVNETFYRFLVGKRFAATWGHIAEHIADGWIRRSLIKNIKLLDDEHPLPTSVDLRGAALAIARVQETYKLNTTDLTKGKIRNYEANTKMSVDDIFELGSQLIDSKYCYYSILWLTEALNRIDANETDNLFKLEILDSLALAYETEEHYPMALETVEKILAMNPNDTTAAQKKSALIIEVANSANESIFERNEKFNKILERQAIEIEDPLLHTDIRHTDHYQFKVYEGLCRGDIQPSTEELAELRCKYVTNKSPFLKIAPLKLEEVSLDPYIVVYHDVIYDAEIELIKSFALPKLKRAGEEAYDGERSYVEFTDNRIGKVAWFKDQKHKYFADITQRVADMTGLSMDLSEELQVVNYGIAGQYEMHFDFALENDLTYEDEGIGNRIATVLFYLSDVAEGGATAFPLLKRAIFPIKGTAVFWLNLYASGLGDLRTKHAGCPVLVGSKWVANKWLHLYDQQFSRLCELYPDHP